MEMPEKIDVDEQLQNCIAREQLVKRPGRAETMNAQ